jgi:hypothetical protein
MTIDDHQRETRSVRLRNDWRSSWRPNEDDLAPWAVVRLEDAYGNRMRRQCSREDFAAGYISALLDYHGLTAFKQESWPVVRELMP